MPSSPPGKGQNVPPTPKPDTVDVTIGTGVTSTPPTRRPSSDVFFAGVEVVFITMASAMRATPASWTMPSSTRRASRTPTLAAAQYGSSGAQPLWASMTHGPTTGILSWPEPGGPDSAPGAGLGT